MSDDDDAPTCDVCGGPATPGGDPADPEVDTICPGCEDIRNWRGDWSQAAPTRTPAHGNTTR
jgi:hypothetical protein